MENHERRERPRIARALRAWGWLRGAKHAMETLDVGSGGACLRVGREGNLRVGDKLRLALSLDERAAPVEVDAEVRWTGREKVGVQFRGRLPAALAACLAAWLGAGEAQGADELVPEFNPNATTQLDMTAGGKRPDEYQVLAAFEQQYEALDACVADAKSRKRISSQLPGDVEMSVLLNPKGKRPLGVNATLPKVVAKDRPLRDCLRAAVAKAPYPTYDGPPVVVELNFQLDAGEVYVEED